MVRGPTLFRRAASPVAIPVALRPQALWAQFPNRRQPTPGSQVFRFSDLSCPQCTQGTAVRRPPGVAAFVPIWRHAGSRRGGTVVVAGLTSKGDACPQPPRHTEFRSTRSSRAGRIGAGISPELSASKLRPRRGISNRFPAIARASAPALHPMAAGVCCPAQNSAGGATSAKPWCAAARSIRSDQFPAPGRRTALEPGGSLHRHNPDARQTIHCRKPASQLIITHQKGDLRQ